LEKRSEWKETGQGQRVPPRENSEKNQKTILKAKPSRTCFLNTTDALQEPNKNTGGLSVEFQKGSKWGKEGKAPPRRVKLRNPSCTCRETDKEGGRSPKLKRENREVETHKGRKRAKKKTGKGPPPQILRTPSSVFEKPCSIIKLLWARPPKPSHLGQRGRNQHLEKKKQHNGGG